MSGSKRDSVGDIASYARHRHRENNSRDYSRIRVEPDFVSNRIATAKDNVKKQDKKLLEEMNNDQWTRFMLSNKDKMTIRPPSLIPGRLFSDEEIDFKKLPKVDLGREGSGHTAQVVNVKGKPSYLVWRTSPACLKKAEQLGGAGGVNPEHENKDLTTEIIAILGGNSGKLWYPYARGNISSQYTVTKKLEETTVARVEAFQLLTLLINNYDGSLTPVENAERIKKAVEKCKNKLAEINTAELDPLKKYDADVVEKYQKYLNEDVDALDSYLIRLEFDPSFDLQTAFGTAGTDSLKYLVEDRLRAILLQGATTYDVISTFENTEDMSDRFSNALKKLNTYQWDPARPISPEHQADFAERQLEEKKDKEMVYHIAALTNAEECRRLRMVIAQAEEDETIVSENDQFFLETTRLPEKIRIPLNKTAHIKHTPNNIEIKQRSINFVVHLITGCITVVDFFPVGFFSGLFNLNWPSLVEMARINFPGYYPAGADSMQSGDPRYDDLMTNMSSPSQSLGMIVGTGFGKFIRHRLIELWTGVKTLAQALFSIMPEAVINDYYIGGRGEKLRPRDSASRLLQFKREIKAIATQIEDVKKEIKNRHESAFYGQWYGQAGPIDAKEVAGRRLARLPHELNTGQWHDPLNAGIRGLTRMGDTITGAKSIYPVIFSVIYIPTLLAILKPSLVSFLGSSYIDFCQGFATQVAHGGLGAAAGTATITAQAVTTTVEGALEGRESTIVKGLSYLESEPVDCFIFFSGVIATGKSIIYGYVPGLQGVGHFFHHELGKTEAFAEFSVGVKFWMLAAHLIEVKGHEAGPPASEQEIKEEMKAVLKQGYCDSVNKQWDDLSAAEQEAVDRRCDELINEFEKATVQPQLGSLKSESKYSKEAKFDADAVYSYRHSLKPRESFRAISEKVDFLTLIMKHSDQLQYLSSATKLEVLAYADELFNHDETLLEALENKLNPEKPHTFFGDFIERVIGYIPLLLRAILFSWVTGNFKRPWEELSRKVKKDGALLVDFIFSNFPPFMMAVLRLVPIRAFCNFLVKVLDGLGTLARKMVYFIGAIVQRIGNSLGITGPLIMDPQPDSPAFTRRHTISNAALKGTSFFYSSYAWMVEQFASVTQASRRANIAPVSDQVFQRALRDSIKFDFLGKPEEAEKKSCTVAYFNRKKLPSERRAESTRRKYR